MRKLAGTCLTLTLVASSMRCTGDERRAPRAVPPEASPADSGAADRSADASEIDARDSAAPLPLSDRPFRKRVLDAQFRAEGVAVFDVNGDTLNDIVTDQYWYESPNFDAHEIRTPEPYEAETTYSRSNAVFAMDVDRDDWMDIIVVPFPGSAIGWYKNPRGDRRAHWQRYEIAPNANVETPVFEDLFNDGREQLVMGIGGGAVQSTLAWLEPAIDPYAPWIAHTIGAGSGAIADPFSHGLGVGDLNRDGRVDVLTSEGWFEAPADPSEPVWTWHASAFRSNECSHMYVWDVNADGLPDVLSSNPHRYGVWWWEQLPAAPGAAPDFVERTIDASFSESHALHLEDMDADGVPEIITGKRFYSHGKSEPGALDAPLLVAYRRVLDASAPGGARFTRTVIDAESGVGTQFEVADVSGDALPDIVVSSKLGLFYFERDARCGGAPAEWLPLLAGSELRDWYPWFPSTGRRDPQQIFKLRDGVLHVFDIPQTDEDQDFGYLASRREYANFRVRFDYRWGTRQFNPARRDGWTMDSGFFVTAVGPDTIWPRALECQVQIGDTGDVFAFDRATFGTTVADPAAFPPVYAENGAPYVTGRSANPGWHTSRVIRSMRADSADDWTHVEITVLGETTEYEVNGNVVMRGNSRRQPSALAPDDPARDIPLVRGRLVVQEEGAEVLFRDLEISGLGPATCADL